jgi:hypothetical protein
VLISLINEYDRDGTITLEVDGITITRDDASDVYANMDGSTPMAGGDGGTMGELQTPTGNIAGQVSIDFDCDPTSGSTFPIGETTVECTATDSAGNSGFGSFVIEVIQKLMPSAEPPVVIDEEPSSPSPQEPPAEGEGDEGEISED